MYFGFMVKFSWFATQRFVFQIYFGFMGTKVSWLLSWFLCVCVLLICSGFCSFKIPGEYCYFWFLFCFDAAGCKFIYLFLWFAWKIVTRLHHGPCCSAIMKVMSFEGELCFMIDCLKLYTFYTSLDVLNLISRSQWCRKWPTESCIFLSSSCLIQVQPLFGFCFIHGQDRAQNVFCVVLSCILIIIVGIYIALSVTESTLQLNTQKLYGETWVAYPSIPNPLKNTHTCMHRHTHTPWRAERRREVSLIKILFEKMSF